MFNFTIAQLFGNSVDILSVFNDKLLIGKKYVPSLYIYSAYGLYFSTISMPDELSRDLWHATWTPNGNIAYTTRYGRKVGIINPQSGRVISTYDVVGPNQLSVANGVVYFVTDVVPCIFKTTDEGNNWSTVVTLKSTRTTISQLIALSSEEFWTLEESGGSETLRVYRLNTTRYDVIVEVKDIQLLSNDDKPMNVCVSTQDRLAYDGGRNMFLSDYSNNTIHTLSVDGRYRSQILSSNHIKNTPHSLAVNREKKLLYVGQSFGVVGIFNLVYG